jgi:exosortase
MVPVPDTVLGMVSFPLQLLATKISVGMIQFCSIPVFREGNMLFFTNTQLEVAEACSGIRSIVSLSMLSILFAYMSLKGWWRKAILVVSAIPIALLANVLRISGTGVLAHYFGDQVARGFLHEFSGMVVFALGMLVLFMEMKILNRTGAGARKS